MTSRLAPLEACRGIAAVVVLVFHFFMGFALPQKEAIVGQSFNVLINGAGAVLFFFTLSGFVLCWNYFHSNHESSLLPSIIKRWPRLALPVILSTLMSWVLFKLNCFYFLTAAMLSKSPWLQTFGYANWPTNFSMSFNGAIIQGATTFFTGIVSYNSSLWTMKPELIGSLVIYLLATFLKKYQFSLFTYMALLMLFIFLTIAIFPYLLPFVFGIFLAYALARHPIKIHKISSFGVLGFGIFLLGYEVSEKNYAWVRLIEGPMLITQNIQIILLSIGSICVIFAVMTNVSYYNFLNNQFSAWLGKLSFPLYLIHVLVMCSFSSWFYIYLMSSQYSIKWVFVMNLLATFAICTLICLPFIWIDQIWIRYLNRLSLYIVSRDVAVQKNKNY